jgi:hypothetical protein
MVYFLKICPLLLEGYISVEASVVSPDDLPADKTLWAATKRSDLVKRRGTRFEQKFAAELVYIEGTMHPFSLYSTWHVLTKRAEEHSRTGNSIFASQFTFVAKKPILTLREIEHHLTGVHCGSGMMILGFMDTESAIDAGAACRGTNGGLIITSHKSCNVKGARAVYM